MKYPRINSSFLIYFSNVISLHFYRLNPEWVQRAGAEIAKEFTGSYAEVTVVQVGVHKIRLH